MRHFKFLSQWRRLAIALCMASVSTLTLFAQGINVSGTVTDETGSSMPGVNVTVSGTTNGVVTDAAGNYSITVPGEASVLVFSFVGYTTKEVTVGSQRTISPQMEEGQQLEEVVVVGYGTQKKANLTGAVASVGGDVLADRPITNIGQGLQGVIPNLQISPAGNAPGQGSSFNIRGYTSLTGGSPLVLVDGVVMDPNLVNPNDVASVSVLKDASSAAIYGARAAYGVILITTKKGTKSSKPVVNATGSYGVSTPIVVPKYMESLPYVEYMQTADKNSNSTSFNGVIPGGDAQIAKIREYYNGSYDSPVYYDPTWGGDNGGKYWYVGNTDWAKELYRNGVVQQYSINVSGGSEKTKYYMSYGYMDQRGILNIYKDKYRRHNINLDVTSDLTKWMTVGLSAKYTNGFEDHPTQAANAGFSAYGGYLKNDLSPLMPIKHPDGNYAGQGNVTNPFAMGAQAGYDQRKINDLWLTGNISIRPFEGLELNADYTYNPYSWNQKMTRIAFREYYNQDAVAQSPNLAGAQLWTEYPWTSHSRSQDQVYLSNANDYYSALNAYIRYTKTFAENHNLAVTAGYNQEVKELHSFSSQRKYLLDASLPVLGLTTGEMAVGESINSWAVQGVFARIAYNYKGKYLVEFNGRYDGSSRFAEKDRFGFFPSVSAGWRISDEAFMEGTKSVLSNLKIRGSYGSLGNQAVESYFPYMLTYSYDAAQPYLIDGKTGMSIQAPGLVSGSLTWENVRQWNIGLDFGFLKDKLTGVFDVFTRNTIGMLTGGKTLAGTLGTGVPQENAADLKTVGWDLSLEWRDNISQVGGSDLNYRVSFVLSDAQAEITKFDNPTKSIGNYYVGRKIGEIWGYSSPGLFQNQAEVDAINARVDLPANDPNYIPQYSPGRKYTHLGDVIYEDKDGNGTISTGDNNVAKPGDRSIIGNSTPRYQYGLTLGVSWYGFDVDIFFQGVGKRNWDPSGDFRYWGVNSEWDVPLRAASDYWSPTNTGAWLPQATMGNSYGNRQTCDRYLQDASYLRLKQLSIGYTLPQSLTQKAGISKVRIYFTGQNLITWTKLTELYDPEIIGTAGSSTSMAGNMSYPIAKIYSFGLNLTF